MKRFLEKCKSLPLSPWLFVTFFFSHAFIRYFDWLRAKPVFIFYIVALLFTSLFFWVINRWLQSTAKTSFILVLWIWVVFYFNFYHTAITQLHLFAISSWLLIPVTAAVIGVIGFLVRRGKEAFFGKLNYFLNALFALFIIADVFEVAGVVYAKKNTLQFETDAALEQKPAGKTSDSLPDIYFMVFDEYASSSSLKENFGFDNSSLDTFLLNNGFYIASNAKSNYSLTVFSIASTLQLSYFKDMKEARYPDDYPAALEAMQTNKLFSLLEQQGYQISNHSIFNLGNYSTHQTNFFHKSAFTLLFDKSMVKLAKVLYLELTPKEQIESLNRLFAEVAAPAPNNKPQFKYLHVLLPHYPFIFEADGKIRSAIEYTRKKDNYFVERYLNQLVFTNKLIRNLITDINKNNPRKKIIVLEGDHGLRFPYINRKAGYDDYRKGSGPFRNLNAYYFFDRDYTQLYDSISPVNSFRVISSQYLGLPCGLLPDKSIF